MGNSQDQTTANLGAPWPKTLKTKRGRGHFGTSAVPRPDRSGMPPNGRPPSHRETGPHWPKASASSRAAGNPTGRPWRPSFTPCRPLPTPRGASASRACQVWARAPGLKPPAPPCSSAATKSPSSPSTPRAAEPEAACWATRRGWNRCPGTPEHSFGRLRQVTPSGAWRGPRWKPFNSVRPRDSTES